ncbi:hypothetical protein [Burkholderia sp. PU8-34]
MGALPAIFAATPPDLARTSTIGPSGWFETRGLPAAASVPRAARDAGRAALLRKASQAATGGRYLDLGVAADCMAARPYGATAAAPDVR